MAWKPEGYPTMSPYLVVEGAQAVIDFCRTVLDATELRRYDRPDGTVMHAELRVGDSVLMLADATDEFSPSPAMLHVYVPDVDATYRRAVEAGAEPLQEPVQKDDPDRRGGVRDAAGNAWWFGTQLG